MLVDYRLPPWLTIKKRYLLFALLIPRKHKVKNIDVYLAPLVEQLQVLWNGNPIDDVSQWGGQKAIALKENFDMDHARFSKVWRMQWSCNKWLPCLSHMWS